MRSMHCSLLQAARAIWHKNNEEAELVKALDMKDRRHASIFGELTVKVRLKNEKYAELAMKYNSCVKEERAAVEKPRTWKVYWRWAAVQGSDLLQKSNLLQKNMLSNLLQRSTSHRAARSTRHRAAP